MSKFVLIHGAWHGGWCWSKIAALLARNGHTVLSPDLPGHGADNTPVSKIMLEGYTNSVVNILEQQTEPVVLVGHSMGGLVISQAAERMPDKIKSLVYVCAFLVRNGETLGDVAQRDARALVMPNLDVSEDKLSARLKPEVIRQAFYTDCSDDDAASAQSRLVAQALAPFMTPVQLSAGKYGLVPRSYVECTHDRAISVEIQKSMFASSPCRKVWTLETDHSPFLSKPDELASILLSEANQ